jgi:hypothetical protein
MRALDAACVQGGRTALMMACAEGRRDVVRCLLAANAAGMHECDEVRWCCRHRCVCGGSGVSLVPSSLVSRVFALV